LSPNFKPNRLRILIGSVICPSAEIFSNLYTSPSAD